MGLGKGVVHLCLVVTEVSCAGRKDGKDRSLKHKRGFRQTLS